MRHRAFRIPGLRQTSTLNNSLPYSSKISKWLEDGHLVKRGGATNWKRQYKLRHNWSRGSCKKIETEIAEPSAIPPVLVRLHEGTIITADPAAGLRAWSMHGNERLTATIPWSIDRRSSAAPSSLAIDGSSTATDNLPISVGFSDGSFAVYALDRRKRSFSSSYLHPPSSNGTVSAMAFSFPYVATLTEAQLLSLYIFPSVNDEVLCPTKLDEPRLLCSLKSHTAWPPLSLAIRRSSTSITTSVAYAMPTYTSGWSVGLQELRLSPGGSIIQSRLATPAGHGFMPLDGLENLASSSGPRSGISAIHVPLYRSTSSSTKPTSLSYTHPYLLSGHSDNTLTLYMVNSNAEELSVGPGILLCGHTSSVSGAHVGDRGKAVSVSVHGNDLRVWELEGRMTFGNSRWKTAWGEASVTIKPDDQKTKYLGGEVPGENLHNETITRRTAQQGHEEPMISNGWVSFDEEQVVMLAEKKQGAQALVVYDFT